MLRSYNSIDQLLSLLSEDEYDSSLSVVYIPSY